MKHFYLSIVWFCSFWILGAAQTNITKPSIDGANGVQVNTYTGALFYQRPDIRIPGRGLSLDVVFSYNSSARGKDWGYGRGWTFSYNMAYYPDSASIVIQQMDGRKNRYFLNNNGGYSRPAGVFDSLQQYQAGKFRLLMNDGTKYFFDNGIHKKLTKIEDRNGNAITLAYADTLLTSLTDPSGRSLQFTWTNGRMVKLTDPNTTPAREVTYLYDSQGNPIKVTDPLGNFIEYKYDDEHKLNAVINENGIPVNIEYNTLTAVRRIISCVSTKTISYNYDLLRTYLVETVGGSDQITTYEFDKQGRLIRQFGNCCGYDVKFEYDASNNISKRIDANGNATLYTYDAKGNVLKEIDPLGNAMVYTYEPNFSFIQSITDRNGNTTSHVYDAKGNLLQRNRPLSIVESFTYDPFGNPLTYQDGRGHTTTYTYDNHGNLASILDAENGLTAFAYDGVGNNTSVTDPNNHNTTLTHDLLNRATRVTDHLGGTIDYTYDPVGNRLSSEDQNGHTTTYVYDGINRMVTTVDPLGQVTSLTYDQRGNVTTVKDANGHETTFTYNELNRLVRKKSPVNDITLYDYDGVGNITSVTLPGGNTVNITYDKLNRITQIGDVLGQVAKYTYDKNSNRLTVADGNDNTTKFSYDALNRILKSEDPAGKSTTFTYDKNDNLTQVVDRRGNVSVFSYDKLNRRQSSQDPLGGITAFTYDPTGNLLSLKDAKNNTTSYTYDALNRRITETYPNGDQRGFAYDPVGNLLARTEPNNYTIAFTYDVANRLLTRDYPNGVSETFMYDKVGKILKATNPHSQVIMAYDATDRLISETLNGKSTTYTHNTNTRQRKITYPGGKQVTEQYDQRGRLSEVNDNAVPNKPLAAYEYDPGNRLLRKLFANTTISEYAYDLNSNLVQINHLLNSMVRYEYGYDDNGNKLFERNNLQTSHSNQFQYDVYDRLTRFKKGTLSGTTIPSPLEDINYNYDLVHNRQSVQVNTTTTTYTSNNLNQYTMLSGGTTATLSYDANGNILNDGLHTYTYDYENRLTAVDDGSTGRYAYDALGRRIWKVVGTDSLYFYYTQLRVIEERSSASGSVNATYVYGFGLDEVLSMQRGGQFYYYHTNALGSVTQVTNSLGAIVEQYEYDVYGQVIFFDGAYVSLVASAIDNPVMFTGQRFDVESGLYFYKARYYSPRLGRFLQRDPLGFVDGMSMYEYTYSNPSNYKDELGLNSDPCKKPWWEDCAVGGALGAVNGALVGAAVGGVGALPGALIGAVSGCALTSLFGGNPIDDLRKGDILSAVLNTALNLIPIPGIKFGGKLVGPFAKSAVNSLDDVVIKGAVNSLDDVAIKGAVNLLDDVVIKGGTNLVYMGVDNAGVVRYIGITGREAAIRFAEHVSSGTAKSTLQYGVVEGATGLTRIGARVWEQALINQYGLQKNGGLLLNKINSLAPKFWAQYGIK